MSSSNVGEYFLVDAKENFSDSEADHFILDAENVGRKREAAKAWKWLKLLIWLGQALLLAANIYWFKFTMKAANRDSVSSKSNICPFSRHSKMLIIGF